VVQTDDGLLVFTHPWWTAEVPVEDPYAPDPTALHACRDRILELSPTLIVLSRFPVRAGRVAVPNTVLALSMPARRSKAAARTKSATARRPPPRTGRAVGARSATPAHASLGRIIPNHK
jgi:hypothetical protein